MILVDARFLSKTSSFISLYAVAAAFIASAKINTFTSLFKILSSKSERKDITGLSVWNFIKNSLKMFAISSQTLWLYPNKS